MKTKKTRKDKKLVKQKLIELYGSMCYYCDTKLPYNKLTIDHIYPVSKAGNLNYRFTSCVLACEYCNVKKGDRIISIETFRKEIMGDKYYPFGGWLKEKPPLIQKKKTRRATSTNVYAKNVVYPENPIVKQKYSLHIELQKAIAKLREKLAR